MRRIQSYILEGDVMQVVPSQRMSVAYRRMPSIAHCRCLNPSPYLFHLDLGDFQVVGASPEVLARLEDGILTVRPIAGPDRAGGIWPRIWRWKPNCWPTPRNVLST